MTTLTKLSAGTDPLFDPLRASLNRGLMVAWINRDLLNRAGCDIRRSIVLYDADRVFVMALPASLSERDFLDRVGTVSAGLNTLGIRYWSKGIK